MLDILRLSVEVLVEILAAEVFVELAGGTELVWTELMRMELFIKFFAELLIELLAKILTEILEVKASLVVYCLGFSVS